MLSDGQRDSKLSDVTVFSVGHSSLEALEFLDLLKAWQISAIADVRSTPWSRRNPQFNRDILKSQLEARGIVYRFMGKGLGGRPAAPDFYSNGVADYEKMSKSATFQDSIKRVKAAATSHHLALLCSEHDPIECHRCLLVGRSLDTSGVQLKHIVSHDHAQSQREIEARLLKLTGEDQTDFLQPRGDVISHAYMEWSRRVAYSLPNVKNPEGFVEDIQWT